MCFDNEVKKKIKLLFLICIMKTLCMEINAFCRRSLKIVPLRVYQISMRITGEKRQQQHRLSYENYVI